MENYVKVGRAHRWLAALYGLATLFFIYALIFDRESINSMIGGIFLTVLVAGLCSAHLAASIGASNAKPWARTLSIIIAVPLLIGFPAGTVVGVYILINSSAEWKVKKYDSKLLDGWPT
jgi:hypothetical protein